jgi:phage repressor protein C with HTH and peptisase S24 domain
MIKDRILKISDYSGLTKELFFSKIGMTTANFRGKAKETPINSTAIENILSVFPEINPEWLLTGKGSMLKGSSAESIESIKSIKKDNQENIIPAKPTSPSDPKGIPLIPTYAMAGFFTGDLQVLECDCEHFIIPTFKGADFLIPVKGASMEPKYSSGDLVACKKMAIDTFFQWNKVYVLDTEQGPLIKRINEGSNKDTLLICSENPQYPPFELKRSLINNIALVVGVIRLE